MAMFKKVIKDLRIDPKKRAKKIIAKNIKLRGKIKLKKGKSLKKAKVT